MVEKIQPFCINLELRSDYLSDYQKRMLKRYGESPDGESISRDVLIPSDMPLHNLHYAIQKLFGWQNSHLRNFRLHSQLFDELTGGTVKGWSKLVGVLFQPPSEIGEDLFWDDNYESGSFKKWLKKKYTGPYVYEGNMEKLNVAQKNVQELLKHFSMMEVQESFEEYSKRSKKDGDKKVKVLKKSPLIDLTLEEMNSSIGIEGGIDNLMESLVVDKILAASDETIDSNDLFPVTKEIIYRYDFGDDWTVLITKYKDCKSFLEKNIVSEEELKESKEIVVKKHKPVCINKEGLSVFDDVGGLGGFADFLGAIYEGWLREQRADLRVWAKSLGWSAAKVSNDKMI
ncbi:IS1096 element passenger TnpR family protein [Geotoga petraea]|uniref:PRiA4b ORF-3-like protein n=1 Tax=Geotoga petraea TaxID=28234 RepID=A0A1G6M4Q8_9BACT|nr:hypothetical protein [Geotoga petraea]SDC50489.1 pRiA4b ORF-3-like protein [Geotoga petraea]